MPQDFTPQGFGSPDSEINFYIANRPQLDDYPDLTRLRSLKPGEIAHIACNTSNHWRKVFNVLAKILFDWYRLQGHTNLPPSWQDYRDLELLQPQAREALLFSPPNFTTSAQALHIVVGKTYATSLNLPPLVWLDTHFAINQTHRLVVCPYLDYRQLSNARIFQLIQLLQKL
jgi:hypothetical protein